MIFRSVRWGPHLGQDWVPGEGFIMYTRLMEELSHAGSFATLANNPCNRRNG